MDFSLQGVTGQIYAFLQMTYSQTVSQHAANITNNQRELKELNLFSLMWPC